MPSDALQLQLDFFSFLSSLEFLSISAGVVHRDLAGEKNTPTAAYPARKLIHAYHVVCLAQQINLQAEYKGKRVMCMSHVSFGEYCSVFMSYIRCVLASESCINSMIYHGTYVSAHTVYHGLESP